MQYKSLAALLFASMAIAAPADTNTETESGDTELGFDMPPSIAVILATAVPTSFWTEATNTANFLSQVEQGMVSNSWPTWYSGLPDSVKEYVTTAVEDYYPSFASSIAAKITSDGGSSSNPSSAEATSTAAPSSGASSSGASSSTESTSADSSSTVTGSSSSSPTSSDAASSSSSASSSASGSASSTTTDGGAAPTGIAMSVAGAAGVLGLALVL